MCHCVQPQTAGDRSGASPTRRGTGERALTRHRYPTPGDLDDPPAGLLTFFCVIHTGVMVEEQEEVLQAGAGGRFSPSTAGSAAAGGGLPDGGGCGLEMGALQAQGDAGWS